MSRKVIGGIAVAVVVGLVVWLLFGRGGKDADKAKPAEGSGRSAEIAPKTTTPTKQPDAPAPRGIAPKWSLDTDPEGPLQLDGQVIGPDGKGVGGAKVWLGSVPPRTATSEDDGSFSFDKLVGRTYALS